MYQVLTLNLTPGKDDLEIERQINLQFAIGWNLNQMTVNYPIFGSPKITLVFKRVGSN